MAKFFCARGSGLGAWAASPSTFLNIAPNIRPFVGEAHAMIKTGNEAVMEFLLIITGSMGSGKTSVLAEASDILALRHIVHAAVDLDALSLAYLPAAAATDAVMYRNLQSVCRNYAALGVTRLLLARALETRAELELCRTMVSATKTSICRLNAGIDTMQQRVSKRESGILQQEFVDRVTILNGILDRARLENFAVINENRPINDVAKEMLIKAGWISDW